MYRILKDGIVIQFNARNLLFTCVVCTYYVGFRGTKIFQAWCWGHFGSCSWGQQVSKSQTFGGARQTDVRNTSAIPGLTSHIQVYTASI